jgi:adenylylsulfate kinase
VTILATEAPESTVMTGLVAPAACLWLTGRRGAGKRTIGAAVAETLHGDGRACALLDADILSAHLAHGPADGGLGSLVWLVRLLTENGVTTIVSVDTPRRADRDALRAEIPNFVEVFVDAPADVCTARSGVADPRYEEPIAPDLRIPTHDRDARASAAQLLSYVERVDATE